MSETYQGHYFMDRDSDRLRQPTIKYDKQYDDEDELDVEKCALAIQFQQKYPEQDHLKPISFNQNNTNEIHSFRPSDEQSPRMNADDPNMQKTFSKALVGGLVSSMSIEAEVKEVRSQRPSELSVNNYYATEEKNSKDQLSNDGFKNPDMTTGASTGRHNANRKEEMPFDYNLNTEEVKDSKAWLTNPA